MHLAPFRGSNSWEGMAATALEREKGGDGMGRPKHGSVLPWAVVAAGVRACVRTAPRWQITQCQSGVRPRHGRYKIPGCMRDRQGFYYVSMCERASERPHDRNRPAYA